MDAHTAVAETPAQETPEIAPENAVENIPAVTQPEEARLSSLMSPKGASSGAVKAREKQTSCVMFRPHSWKI